MAVCGQSNQRIFLIRRRHRIQITVPRMKRIGYDALERNYLSSVISLKPRPVFLKDPVDLSTMTWCCTTDAPIMSHQLRCKKFISFTKDWETSSIYSAITHLLSQSLWHHEYNTKEELLLKRRQTLSVMPLNPMIRFDICPSLRSTSKTMAFPNWLPAWQRILASKSFLLKMLRVDCSDTLNYSSHWRIITRSHDSHFARQCP